MVVRPIVETQLWTFLATFKGLQKIRCTRGNWRNLERYTGGFGGGGRRTDSLISMAALMACAKKCKWDVKLETFDLSLGDVLYFLETPEPEMHCPRWPVANSPKDVGNVLRWLKENDIGWSGFMRVPDCTDYWDGPTYAYWKENEQPNEQLEALKLSVQFPEFEHPMNDRPDIFEWDTEEDVYRVKDGLVSYMDAITDSPNSWNMGHIGVNFTFEVTWYNHWLVPQLRMQSPSRVISPILLAVCLRIPASEKSWWLIQYI